MKSILTICIILLLHLTTSSQNCSAVSSGFTPINDLGPTTFTNAWNVSWQGGLYPNGSNFLPPAHKSAGLSQMSLVLPRNQSGIVDTAAGKIVWLSIGMSNTTQETQQFIPLANAHPNKNPKVLLVDGAQGGQSASVISSPWITGYTNFWNTVNNRLANAGATAQQVQVIWFKEADQATKYSNVHDYYDSMMVMIPRIMNDIKIRFPNVQLCYMASRISARYATSALNPEPYAYYTGWAVKKVIEKQINGDPQLQFTGSNAKSPWLSWGIYMWSDGNTPQVTNPAVFWSCSTDFVNDGTHPTLNGQQKVASLLLNFFSTDSTCVPWFLKSATVTNLKQSFLNENAFLIFPNPAHSEVILQISGSSAEASDFQLDICDATGRKLKSIKISNNKTRLQLNELSHGLYYYTITEHERLRATGKLVLD